MPLATVALVVGILGFDNSVYGQRTDTTFYDQAFDAAPFIDATQSLGITANNLSGSKEKRFILESLGSGAAWLDYDGDEDLDLYLISGSTLEAPGQSSNTLYRNDGQAGFTDVTASAGVGDTSWGFGTAVADYDNDGDLDLFVSNFGRNMLYRNNGNGTFSDVTESARLSHDRRWSTSCAFADFDNDGWLDLYVVNYLEFDPQFMDLTTGRCFWKGRPVMCGPEGFPSESDVMYRNNGDGTFTDVSVPSGIGARKAYGLGVVIGDYDIDGDSDIFIANDSEPNFLFRNNGDGTFTEVGLLSGIALSGNGREQAGMGIDLGDWNNDGYQDVFITNFSDDYNILYSNIGNGLFQDASATAGVAWPGFYTLGWGAGFFDVDNDADLDLFIANGHVYPQVDELDDSGKQGDPLTTYPQQNHLYLNRLNEGQTGFAKVENDAFVALQQRRPSRAAAFGDFNNDGLIDILVTNENDTPTLLQGNSGKGHDWLKVRLIGTKSNRDGIGAFIRARSGNTLQMREVRSGASYLAANDIRAHFGLGRLGPGATIDELEIKWPSGSVQSFANLAANRIVTIDEARGVIRSVPAQPRLLLSSNPTSLEEIPQEDKVPRAVTGGKKRPASLPTLRAHLASLLDRASVAFAVGRYDEAAAAYQMALVSLNSRDGDSWQLPAAALGIFDKTTFQVLLAKIYDNLGVALFRTRSFPEAERNLKSALAVDSSNPKFLANLGICYFHWKRFREAEESLRQAVRLNPTDAKYHYNWGRALTEIGNYDEAIKALAKALKLSSYPDYEGIRADSFYYLALSYLRQAQWEYAVGFLYQTLREAPGHRQARYKLARLLIERGNEGEAGAHLVELRRTNTIIEDINDLLQVRPLAVPAERRLAELYASANLFSMAIRRYKRLLMRFPKDEELHFQLAKLYLGYGKAGRVDAIQELEYTLMLNPKNREARNLLRTLHD